MPLSEAMLAILALLVRIRQWNRCNEPLRVRVLRPAQDLIAGSLFHELAIA